MDDPRSLGTPVLEEATDPRELGQAVDTDPRAAGVAVDTDPRSAGTLIEEPAEKESPTWISDPLSKQDIANIATKYGLETREQIDSLITQAYLRGGTVEGETRPVQYAAGVVSDLLLPGDIPAFAQKKLQDSENVRKAMDDISSLVEQNKSKARAVGEFVGGLAVPGLGVAKTVGKITSAAGKIGSAAIVGSMTGAVGGVAESQEGQEVGGAKVGAAVGAGLGAGIGALGKWATQAAAKKAMTTLSKVETGDVETDKKLIQLIEKEAADTFDKDLAVKVLDPNPLNTVDTPKKVVEQVNTQKAKFLNYLSDALGEKPLGEANPEKVEVALRAKIGVHGQKYIDNAYQNFHESVVADKYQGFVALERLDNIQRGFLGKPRRWIEAAMYMADRLDRKTGSHFGKYLNQVSTDLNEYKNTSSKQFKILNELIKETRVESEKLGISYRDLNNNIYKTLDGELDGVVNKELITKWENMFEDLRVLNNTVEGEEVIKRVGGENPGKYVTHTIIEASQAVDKIQTKLFHLEDTLPQFKQAMDDIRSGKIIGTNNFVESIQDSAAKEDVTDLLQSIKILNGLEEAPVSINEALHIFNIGVKNPKDAIRLGEMTAKVSKARKGGTPKLIREQDLAKITEQYILNTLKQAYVGKHVSNIKGELVALQNAGVDKAYMNDISNWLLDIQGNRADTLASELNEGLRTLSMKARQEAVIRERKGDRIGAAKARAIAAAPAAIKLLSDQVYPNTLGIFTNQRSPVKNLFQIFMQTSPEVGYRYAFGTMVKSLTYAVSHPATAEKWLKERKLHGEMWEAFSDASMLNQDSPAMVRKFLSANHTVANVTMWPFSKSEMVLRYAAAQLGHKTGADLVDALGKSDALQFNHISALKFMDNMLDADRREVEGILRKIIQTSDEVEKSTLIEELKNNIGQQLIQKTIFDYNKANASIIARYLPAPLLVFTKFPTIVASDIMHKIETKPAHEMAAQLTRGYLAPWVIASMVDKVGEENLDDDNAITLILGKGGFSGVTALEGMGGLKGLANPLIAAPFKVLKGAVQTGAALSTGDTEEAAIAAERTGKDVLKAASLYGPVGGVTLANIIQKSFLSED